MLILHHVQPILLRTAAGGEGRIVERLHAALLAGRQSWQNVSLWH
jgi:hypothetical protein